MGVLLGVDGAHGGWVVEIGWVGYILVASLVVLWCRGGGVVLESGGGTLVVLFSG